MGGAPLGARPRDPNHRTVSKDKVHNLLNPTKTYYHLLEASG